MTTYNAVIYRTDNNSQIIAGSTAKKTKMQMFRQMQQNGDAVVELFDDCGAFEFIWNKAAKVWEFFSEAGDKVGVAKFEVDEDKKKRDAENYYRQNVAAYEAQRRMMGVC